MSSMRSTSHSSRKRRRNSVMRWSRTDSMNWLVNSSLDRYITRALGVRVTMRLPMACSR